MSALLFFSLEIGLCLGVSFILIVLLRPLLSDVLIDTCGTKKRAEFWIMFTQLMLVISPLLIVVYFVPTTTIEQLNVMQELRQTLFRILLGDFIALCVIGQVIWKSAISPYNQLAPKTIEGVK